MQSRKKMYDQLFVEHLSSITFLDANQLYDMRKEMDNTAGTYPYITCNKEFVKRS